ncbi:uncharacterized protein LOC100845047 isoform X4 [Brachypodium distachyon]|uniref:uncharacterized protein LOC100845047 isoform X4 n=1 Tax=Brachypodium distachyon TaxID=15368 RepID=UPI000D0CDA91|nr:uncharacterized protein LOC100845047 isoform X4 [Brachypodium distachyon]|eukprot:XP_014751886.2 uncharacterized protein LOC100845047 isoform X4 [Brachypodium distachyon]
MLVCSQSHPIQIRLHGLLIHKGLGWKDRTAQAHYLFVYTKRSTGRASSSARQGTKAMATATPSAATFFSPAPAAPAAVPRLPRHANSRLASTTLGPRASLRPRAFLPPHGHWHGPLIPASDHWGNWTVLLSAAALGVWSEKSTRAGKALSGALVTVLLGLAASTAGLVAASDVPAYRVVLEYLLPLAVPLLLFAADLRRVLRSTGALLLAFLLGSLATTIGTVATFLLVPMRSLGKDNWRIAAALMSRHIGGAVNYVAVAEALEVSPSVVAAGLAADNVICALYFTTLFALAAKIPAQEMHSQEDAAEPTAGGDKLPVLQSATAIAVSFAICKAGKYMTSLMGIQGGSLPCITAIVVALATLFPSYIGKLAPSGEALAVILMQVFFAVVGANGSISNVINTTPGIFAFAFVQITVHLLLILGAGKLLGFEDKLLLIASNANVGGPTTACGMATTKGWTSLMVPGILAGIFGIAIATFLGIAFGMVQQIHKMHVKMVRKKVQIGTFHVDDTPYT